MTTRVVDAVTTAARRVGPLPFAAAGALWATAIAVGLPWGFDSHAYWLTRGGIVYHATPVRDRYLYSPAFAQAIRPLTELPWPFFAAVWSLAAAGAYLWVTRGIGWRWRLPLLCVCLTDVAMGNVWWLFILACIYGSRRPALWVIPLLTKITPAVGLIWFATRREWRRLLTVVVCAMVVVAASVAISPGLWVTWIRFLTSGSGGDPDPTLYPRLVVAATLTIWCARRSRADLLPVAIILATPVPALASLVMLTALPALRREHEIAAVPATAARHEVSPVAT
jgi:hypothetical protein